MANKYKDILAKIKNVVLAGDCTKCEFKYGAYNGACTCEGKVIDLADEGLKIRQCTTNTELKKENATLRKKLRTANSKLNKIKKYVTKRRYMGGFAGFIYQKFYDEVTEIIEGLK